MANHDATSSDFIYDVFLSFRGGTRHGFTDHLYHALCRNGINTFRDDENLRIGDEIRSTLFEAIEKSRISIVVLCENYASSTWCLDELVKIIECKDKDKKRPVVAIFYKVEPSDVRKQKNKYETAMIEHETSFGKESKEVKAWRSALFKVCKDSGEHFRNNMSEFEFIKKIVKKISPKLPLVPLQIKRLVGLDSRFEEVKSLIDIESNDTLCMLGIYGAGGIGKTTFAVDLFNKIRNRFEAASFLGNVTEKSDKSTKGLEDLQKTLLSEMGEETQTLMGSTFKGGFEIKRRLGHKRVLLVLDDVESIEQLDSLAGGRDWFGPGSRIIITTRDTSVLDKHVLDDVHIKKYEMKELNDRDSLELFCWHAFNMSRPAENFEDISIDAVSYAKGIALALRVIGSNLKGGSEEEWRKELDRYRNVPDAKIQGVLEISYNSLSDLDQNIFLDIACFFKGERWEYVERILKACDFYPVIRVFVSKCLITVDEYGCLEMHDLIQDMGREIVRKKSRSNPGERSRIWSHKDILEVLKQNSGSSIIEGILLAPPQQEVVDYWINSAFEKMENLRILIVRNTKFSAGPTYLPNRLRLLDWEEYPSKSFPQDFYPNRIVDFYLPRSRIYEHSLQKFEDLTFINLSNCQSITQIPDVSLSKYLRVFIIDGCRKLVTVHESVGFAPNLVYLNASECTALKSFVPRMYLPSLEKLSLNFCRSLIHFPNVVQEMDTPLKIHMKDTAIKKFPPSIDKLTGLEYIDMSSCTELGDLPSNFLMLPKLDTLKIAGCSQLGESFRRFKESHSVTNGCPNLKTLDLRNANLSDENLHAILENFPNLEDLNVSRNDFVSLPECIKGSSFLKSLDVSYCENLQKIPELPSSVQKVDAIQCRSLSSEASSVLWSKVCKDMGRLEVVMPKTKIPECFGSVSKEEIPLFWARRKFPIVALAFVFGKVNEIATSEFSSLESQPVGLHLFIDGREIRRKEYRYFSVVEDHVLLCDLRALFNDEEWVSLDASLGDGWKAVQVQFEADLILSHWGVYVYNQETNMEDINFNPPISNSSRAYMSSLLVPTRTPRQRIKYILGRSDQKEVFDKLLKLSKTEEERGRLSEIKAFGRTLFTKFMILKRDKDYAGAYGTSLKQQDHEVSPWEVLRLTETFKENIEKQIEEVIADKRVAELVASSPKIKQCISLLNEDLEEFLTIAQELTKEEKKKGKKKSTINMPIILEECQPTRDLEKAPSRQYWGTLEIKDGDPMFNAVIIQQWLGFLSMNEAQGKLMVPIILLKCHRRSTWDASSPSYGGTLSYGGRGTLKKASSFSYGGTLEEASSSGHGGTFEEEYHDPLLQQALMRRIEQDVLGSEILIKAYGKLKASVVPAEFTDNPLLQALITIRRENLRSEFKNKPYGRLKWEHDALRKRFEEYQNEVGSGQSADELISMKHPRPRDRLHEGAGLTKKLAAVWKERDEELQGLYDDGIEGYKISRDFEDVMGAMYLDGLRDGLLEAQGRLLDLDIERTVGTVLNEEEFEVEEDPVLQVLRMIRQGNVESGIANKPYAKLKLQHVSLRKKFQELGKENSNTTVNFTCSRRQYDDLIEKFETLSAELISMKHQRRNVTLGNDNTDSTVTASDNFDLESKGDTKWKRLGTVWKERGEELQRVFDDGVQGLKNSREYFEDVMGVIYLDGLRDGFLEAQVSFLAMDLDLFNKESDQEHAQAPHNASISNQNLAERKSRFAALKNVWAQRAVPAASDPQKRPAEDTSTEERSKEDLEKKIVELQEERDDLRNKCDEVGEANSCLKAEVEQLRDDMDSERAGFDATKKKLEGEVARLMEDCAAAMVNSFENALEQISILCPGLDTSTMGAFKVVDDGQIMDPESDEEVGAEAGDLAQPQAEAE